MEIGAALVLLLIGAGVGVAIGVVALRTYQNNQANNWRKQIEEESRATVNAATQQANKLVRDAEEKSRALLKESDDTATRRRRELDKEDERLQGRRESLDKYIKRLEQLEALALEQHGVRQAYAIQAGREVRVMVDSNAVDDARATKIAHDVAKRIEEEMTYPGEIRVTVIRELRAVGIAQ